MYKKISILIPVFNEEANIIPITEAIKTVFNTLPHPFEIVFVNDGSTDKSLAMIEEVCRKESNVFFASFSRNFGKDSALLAGFNLCTGDAVVTIDADLQHPPEMIPQMIDLWNQGNEVVYTYRADKNHHASNFNQITSTLFYKILNNLSDVDLEDGIADYRLRDSKVVNTLKKISEDKPFFRGLIKWVGFQQIGIPYTPNPRISGITKYNVRALIHLALQGITSFSIKPLLIAIYLGFTFSALSLLYIPYILYSFYHGLAISGWASTIFTLVFFGGLQLMILGILGIYLGKLFMQNKQRPQYIIAKSNINHI